MNAVSERAKEEEEEEDWVDLLLTQPTFFNSPRSHLSKVRCASRAKSEDLALLQLQ